MIYPAVWEVGVHSATVTGRRSLPDLVGRLPQTRAALAFAELAHHGQTRTVDGAPFIEHPLEVGRLLHDAGAADHVIAAGVLHDTLEKTPTDADELRRRFGSTVAGLVAAVSEDPSVRGYRARKAALRRQVVAAGEDAATIFAADKVSKARELRLGAGTGGARLRARRLEHYRHCLGLLEELLGDTRLVRQLRAELRVLDRLAAPAAIRGG